MTTTIINIDDMHCASCVGKIRSGLEQVKGIVRLQFNPARRQLVVSHESLVATHELLHQIELTGFHPYLSGSNNLSTSFSLIQLRRDLLKRLGIAGLSMMQVMTVAIAMYLGAFSGIETEYRRVLELTSLLFCIPVVSYSAMPFFASAIRSVRGGLSMDVPIALAIAIAFSASVYATLTATGEVYYDSVVMFTFLLLLARFVDLNLKHQVDTEDALMSSLPHIVTVIANGKHEKRAIEDVHKQDIVWVGEGEQIPIDGTLLSAHTSVDEALLSGEVEPSLKERGSTVYAGTFNQGPGISIQVQAISTQTRMAAINLLASKTLLAKNKIAQRADQLAGIFIPAVLLLSLSTYFIWHQVDSTKAFSAALAVLIISCPCALSLAIPAALSAAMVRLRHAGVVLKDSKFLELLPRVSDIFIDKTGTLTLPRPGISDVKTLGGYDESWCLELAGALQSHSSHPFAKCFSSSSVQITQVEAIAGAGVKAIFEGKEVRIGSGEFCGIPAQSNEVYLSMDGRPAAIFRIENPLRKYAHSSMSALRNEGLNIHIVSGDRKENCQSIARELGLPYEAAQAPETKWEILRHRMSEHRKVMFVGDGLNDLPSLAGADVSVAMMESNDLVKSKSDIILFTARLDALVDLFGIAKKTQTITTQNLWWAFSYNILAIPAAALGYAPPWLAALGMALSSTLVMLNATRLLRVPLQVARTSAEKGR